MSVDIVRATVTQASPLLVKVDGAATATAAETLNGYAPALNHRVRVAVVGSTLLVLGRAGGHAPTLGMTVQEEAGLSANDSSLLVSFNGIGLRRVLVGAPDSAGAGFRTLRILN